MERRTRNVRIAMLAMLLLATALAFHAQTPTGPPQSSDFDTQENLNPEMLPIDRTDTTNPGPITTIFNNAPDDWADDAGTTSSVDFITQIPLSSIVLRSHCSVTENVLVSDIQPGDVIFSRVAARNQTTGAKAVTIGFLTQPDGTPVGPMVAQIQPGTLPAGGTYWHMCSIPAGGTTPYCSSIISGKYGVTTNFNSTLPVQMLFKSPSNLSSAYRFLWHVADICAHYCCTLGTQCDCTAITFGVADKLNSSSQLTATAPTPYASFKMVLPSQAISQIRGLIGPGTWRVKIAFAIGGDAWTDHANQHMDWTGHHLGMTKTTLVVP